MKAQPIKPYRNDSEYSYTCGAYATHELLTARPEQVEGVYLHPDYDGDRKPMQRCDRYGIPVRTGGAYFRRINQKENTYVLGLFRKYRSELPGDEPHVLLVNPGDMGNLGTIVRTLAGFGLGNLAILTPAADIWNPKTIRASMGALFRINFMQFDSLEAYRGCYRSHRLYPFMLDGETELAAGLADGLFTLVFGNESTGLAPRYRDLGVSVKIPQSTEVDSLNLAVAVGVGVFQIMRGNKQKRGDLCSDASQ